MGKNDVSVVYCVLGFHDLFYSRNKVYISFLHSYTFKKIELKYYIQDKRLATMLLLITGTFLVLAVHFNIIFQFVNSFLIVIM